MVESAAIQLVGIQAAIQASMAVVMAMREIDTGTISEKHSQPKRSIQIKTW